MTHMFILDKIESPPLTGERKVVIELAKCLAKLKREVYLYSETCEAGVEGTKIARMRDVASLPLRSKNTFFEYHVPSGVFKKTFWTKFVGKTRFIYAFMGGDLDAIFSRRSRISLGIFERMVNKVLAVADYQRRIISRYVDVDIAVIPPFVDGESIKKKPNKEKTLEENDRVKLLFMGVPSRDKGLDVLLKAYAILLREYPNSRLIMADSGRNREASTEARKLISQLRLQEYIDYTGVVNPLEMLSHADLFVYPARTIKDTMAIPLSILEALSVGTPAVSADIGGVSEALPTSHIAQPGDHLTLYHAMSKALKSRDPPPLPPKFLKENVLPMYLELYEELAQ